MKPINLFLFAIIPLFACGKARAQSSSDQGGFSILASAKILSGKSSSADPTLVPERDMTVLGLDVALGYRVSVFFLGAGASGSQWYQRTDAKSVNSTNTSGTMVNYSAQVGVMTSSLGVVGRYILNSNYYSDKTDANGNSIHYNSVTSPLSVLAFFRFGARTFLGVEWETLQYTESKVGETSTPLSSAGTMKFSGIGLALGYIF